MGYACPVCGDPQADATHLANHLAFTALVRGGDHEEYLDEQVPEWESMDESTLGDRVVDLAEETDYPQVFEDTTGDGHTHDHADAHTETDGHHGRDRPNVGRDVPDAMLQEAEEQLADADAPDTEEVLDEALEMTRKRRERAADNETDDGETDDGERAADSETDDRQTDDPEVSADDSETE